MSDTVPQASDPVRKAFEACGWNAAEKHYAPAERPSGAELPALPEAVRMSSDQSYLGYTAEQMRAYARSAILAASSRKELQAAYEACKREAQQWKQEARTANATIAEIYQLCTGKTGEPGNWNGAEPVRALFAASPIEASAQGGLTLEFIEQHIGSDEGDRDAVIALVREVEAAHGIR